MIRVFSIFAAPSNSSALPLAPLSSVAATFAITRLSFTVLLRSDSVLAPTIIPASNPAADRFGISTTTLLPSIRVLSIVTSLSSPTWIPPPFESS